MRNRSLPHTLNETSEQLHLSNIKGIRRWVRLLYKQFVHRQLSAVQLAYADSVKEEKTILSK